MLYIFYELGVVGTRHARRLGADVGKVYFMCGVLTLFVWTLYPVCWGTLLKTQTVQRLLTDLQFQDSAKEAMSSLQTQRPSSTVFSTLSPSLYSVLHCSSVTGILILAGSASRFARLAIRITTP
jgi:hypothetical protein